MPEGGDDSLLKLRKRRPDDSAIPTKKTWEMGPVNDMQAPVCKLRAQCPRMMTSSPIAYFPIPTNPFEMLGLENKSSKPRQHQQPPVAKKGFFFF